jgi:hypothetical protein
MEQQPRGTLSALGRFFAVTMIASWLAWVWPFAANAAYAHDAHHRGGQHQDANRDRDRRSSNDDRACYRKHEDDNRSEVASHDEGSDKPDKAKVNKSKSKSHVAASNGHHTANGQSTAGTKHQTAAKNTAATQHPAKAHNTTAGTKHQTAAAKPPKQTTAGTAHNGASTMGTANKPTGQTVAANNNHQSTAGTAHAAGTTAGTAHQGNTVSNGNGQPTVGTANNGPTTAGTMHKAPSTAGTNHQGATTLPGQAGTVAPPASGSAGVPVVPVVGGAQTPGVTPAVLGLQVSRSAPGAVVAGISTGPAGSAGVSAGALASTGVPLDEAITIASAMLALGGAFELVSRRRRNAA